MEDRPAGSAAAAHTPTLRSLVPTVYAPSFAFAVGQGAVIPIVALTARDVGASASVAALAVALRGVGTLCFDVPSGWLIARFGERRAMVIGTAILIGALIGCIASTTPWMFAVSMFLMGNGWSVWLTARLTYVSEVMPRHMRARALSLLGGVQRIGNFVGPFVGAIVIVGNRTAPVYVVHIVLAFVGCLALVLIADPHRSSEHTIAHVPHGVVRVVREHRRTLLTAGAVAGSIGLMRSARHALLPLWADSIGLDARQVSLIFGISSALDMIMFFPAGVISDRWGRKFVALPCMLLLSGGLAAVPLTDGFGSLLAVALVIGLGNGLGSGIVMTLGADFAPAVGRVEFIGVWRLVTDVGTAGGPVVLSVVEVLASLGAGAGAVAGFGVLGVLVMARLPEPLTLDDPPAARIVTPAGVGAARPN